MPRTATLRRPDPIEESTAGQDSQPIEAVVADTMAKSGDDVGTHRHALLWDVGYGFVIGLLAAGAVLHMISVHGW